MQELARYWAGPYDWRKCEVRLQALPHFMTEIDGLDIHFIHVRSAHPHALPVIITHGWPGSIIELLRVIDPLTNPTAHGGSADDAFDVVIPSIPDYGYSGKPRDASWTPDRIAAAWVELMKRLGYTHYVAQGSDRGAVITDVMAVKEPPGLLGIHSNMPGVHPARGRAGDPLRHRRPSAPRPVGRGAERLGADQLPLHQGHRLRGGDGHVPADALRAGGLPGRPGGLDDQPRRAQLRGHRGRTFAGHPVLGN